MTTYPAYDTYGAIQLPTAAGDFTPIYKGWGEPEKFSSSDPCLSVIADFLATYLVTDGQTTAAWREIGGDKESCLKTVFLHDPFKGFFSATQVPALYLFRDGCTTAYIADDWCMDTTKLKGLWVFPLPTQTKQRIKAPFVNVITKAVNNGIETGRTPSWIQPGDADPSAPTLGSLFWPYAGFASLDYTGWQWAELRVEMDAGNSYMRYPAVEMTFTLVEQLKPGIGKYATLKGADATIISATPAQTAPWVSLTFYGASAVVTPAIANGSFYQCTTPGISGVSPPTWTIAPGSVVNDGTAAWTCLGPVSTVLDSGPLG